MQRLVFVTMNVCETDGLFPCIQYLYEFLDAMLTSQTAPEEVTGIWRIAIIIFHYTCIIPLYHTCIIIPVSFTPNNNISFFTLLDLIHFDGKMCQYWKCAVHILACFGLLYFGKAIKHSRWCFNVTAGIVFCVQIRAVIDDYHNTLLLLSCLFLWESDCCCYSRLTTAFLYLIGLPQVGRNCWKTNRAVTQGYQTGHALSIYHLW